MIKLDSSLDMLDSWAAENSHMFEEFISFEVTFFSGSLESV
jgi:hypothetical protein